MTATNNLKVAGKTATLGPHDLSRIHAASRKRERRRLRNARIEAELGNHPDCLRKVGRDWIAECRVCGRDYELPCEIGEFSADYSYCGGSDRCTP